MADSGNASEKKHTCSVCGISSDDRVLLCGEDKGAETYVCVRCLPVLIHGGH